MKKGRIKSELTRREEELMQMLWASEKPMRVRDLVSLYPEPKPHFNTVSTVVRGLEEKGFVAHEVDGHGFAYYAVARQRDFRDRSLSQIISGYFGNSYLDAVSTLVEEEKISVDELTELISMIEETRKS